MSLSLPTPTHRSPNSRRATFNPHESGNVAATVQAKRKKGHQRSGSVHMYELFSPSHELLKAAAAGANSGIVEQKEPRSPLSARLLGTKGDEAEGEQTVSELAAATVANANGVESSPSRRAARHRTMLTISTTGSLHASAENTPASRGRQLLPREAKETAEPGSAQLVINQPGDAAGADINNAAGDTVSASRPITPSLTSRPITPLTPTTPEAVHSTSALRALRTIKNKDTFHTIAHGHHYHSHSHSHHHSHSSSSAYAHHYHAHIVHQPDIKAMNGTITFMTRLFNVSDTFRTLACKQAFMRQLISAVFASATMGTVLPHTAPAQQQQQQQRRAAAVEDSRSASPAMPPIVHHASTPFAPSLATLEGEEGGEQGGKERVQFVGSTVVNDDPSVPTAPAIDLRIYAVHSSEPGSPLSMGRQYSEELLDASPSPSASSTGSRSRHLGDRKSSMESSHVMPRVRKAASVVVTTAHRASPLEQQPVRGILANIDQADLFRHSTSVLLFQLLRQIVVQNLLTRTKGTQMLIDCLDQAPAHTNLQQRIRYQTTLLAGLSARLEERLSGLVILNNSKLAYTVDRLGQLFVERLEQGMFLNGGPSTFQFILHILLMPECRQLVDDMSAGEKDKSVARASMAGMRVIRPLYDILNQVVLYMCEGWGNNEVTAADIVQLNETLLQHAPLLLGEHNSSRTLVTCLCHHLYKQMASADDEVSGSAIRLWSWLMKNKLETMMELIRANINEQVQSAVMSRAASSSQIGGVDAGGPLSPPPVSEGAAAAGDASPAFSNPVSPTSSSGRAAFVPPPITRKRLVDLLDDDGKGGFDQLLQAATTGPHSDAAEPHWMTEFRHWLRNNDKRISAVFAVTLQPQWSAYLAAQKREQSNSWNKQQAHVIQDMSRHRQEEQDRLKKAAQMELAILSKLQTTSNVEIQRLLRRDQRLTEIDKQADRAWCKVREAMTVAQLMADNVEHKQPPTQERLKRMRDEVAGKRSWQLMMERDEAVDEDDWRMTGDDNSIHVDEWEADIGGDRSSLPSTSSDSSLVFRQPWRVEPSEGPARVRRRLCSQVAQKPDAPLFTHPYRLWEEERRSSVTEEREKQVEGAESENEGAETDVDVHEQETIEMDVTVDTGDRDGQEAEYGDEQKLGDLPSVSEQSAALDGESEESKEAEPSESAAGRSSTLGSHVRHTSIKISPDGDIVDTDSTSHSSSLSSSPRPPVRSPLRIDTRRTASVTLAAQPAVPDASLPSPRSGSARQLSLETTSPAIQRLRSSSLSASPRSGPRSAHRGLSLTATSSDSIPAVAAEPRRRRERHGQVDDEDDADSPRTPQSTLRQLNIGGSEAADSSAAATPADPLPSSNSLMPTISAPVYSVSPSLDTSNLDISIVAPSETDSESKPPTPPRQSVSEFTSPEHSARRAAFGRPRSMTAEDAAPQSLAPPAGAPTLQTSHSVEALARADTTGNSPQPLTPSVPLPGSQDDDEGAEADELLFLEEDKLKLLMNGDDIRQTALAHTCTSVPCMSVPLFTHCLFSFLLVVLPFQTTTGTVCACTAWRRSAASCVCVSVQSS